MSQPLSAEQLLGAWRRMVTIREFEERLHREMPKGMIPGFTHLYSGQEAIAVGVCDTLDREDVIVSTHRGHGHCLAKGCEVKPMMQEIYGRAGGLCGGKGGSMHIADFSKGMLGANGIVGGGPPLATGAALAFRNLGNRRVSVGFGGDGSANQGTVFEAMNMAVVLKVPTLFVFENNGYSENTAAEYAIGARDLAERCAAFGMPAETGDGTDFFDVYARTRRAVERARNGEGPSSLVFTCTRFFGHFEGDPQKYRAADEVDTFRQTMDCLGKFRDRVTAEGWLQESALQQVHEDVLALIDAAVEEAMAAPLPDLATLTTDVYTTY